MTSARNIRRRVLALLATGLFLSPAACQKPPEPPAARPAAQRPAVPDFTLKDLSGRTVALSQLRGKPVFLDFWATWCGPCRMSIPSVQKLHEEFGDRLQVLGLNVDEDTGPVADFVKRMGMTYPVLLVDGSGVDGQYGVSGIPSFLLIDKNGRAVDGWAGFDPRYADRWRIAVDRLLSE